MVNTLISYYVRGEISRETLVTSLGQIGFSQQIIDIHLRHADRKKAVSDANKPNEDQDNQVVADSSQ